MSNVLPAMTFVMAALFRMEKVDIKMVRSQTKIAGTVVCVGGAMLMTLYKGPIVPIFGRANHNHFAPPSSSSVNSDKDWTVGSLLLVAACLAWAAFFILQAAVLRKYSAQLSLTTLICFIGTLQSMAITLAIEHEPSVWALGWNMNLLTAVYSGVVASAIAYYVQGLCMELKGPVFATAFSPLMMIIVAVMGSVILAESIYFGSVLGGVLIVAGLYAVLWGKLKDHKILSGKEHRLEVVVSTEMKTVKDVTPDQLEAAHATNKVIKTIACDNETDRISAIGYTETNEQSCLPGTIRLAESCTVDIAKFDNANESAAN